MQASIDLAWHGLVSWLSGLDHHLTDAGCEPWPDSWVVQLPRDGLT